MVHMHRYPSPARHAFIQFTPCAPQSFKKLHYFGVPKHQKLNCITAIFMPFSFWQRLAVTCQRKNEGADPTLILFRKVLNSQEKNLMLPATMPSIINTIERHLSGPKKQIG
jgi:hypothetical protein